MYEQGAENDFSDIKEKVMEKKERIIESYTVDSNNIKIEINIVVNNFKKIYTVIMPEISIASMALLDDIKEKLIGAVEVNPSQIFDSKLMDELKSELEADAAILLEDGLPDIDEKTKGQFILKLIYDLLGLGDLEIFLCDDQIEEIVINSASEPVRIYHKKHGWLESNIFLESESQITNYANIIARRIGREITTLNPLLDAHLMTKDRANAILTPISTKGSTITIRKFARDPWTATDFIKNKTASSEVLALIWLCIQYELNILISGGTGSGKTSFLNVCMPFMPPNQRIISVEDTRELQLPEYLYWCPLNTRPANPEGKGEVSMLDLIINSLRMRPDRIIMGEIRKQREAEVLFEAMHTGHSVYGTLHADTCSQTITRLVNPPISIPESMLDSVHLNVVMFRDRRLGVRRVFEVGEFIEEKDPTTRMVHFNPNILYRWDPKTDEIVQMVKGDILIYHKIGVHTGLSYEEILQDLNLKKKILDWLVEHNLHSIGDMGKVMNRYYVDMDAVIDVVNNNGDPKRLLE